MVDIEYHMNMSFDKTLDSFVVEKYKEIVENYNNESIKNSEDYRDSGFDLFITGNVLTKMSSSKKGDQIKINHGVMCEVYKKDPSTGNTKPSGYYLYPRSSISKTPFRLANSVGIIDSGYRGNLIAKVDKTKDEKYEVSESDLVRMFQIVMPDMSPLTSITIKETLSSTERGSGGFGSTGN